jgi:RNA polymerase sigma-70 factor (ECF subfamily)
VEPVACDPGRLAALVRAGDVAALDRITRCHGERLLAVGVRWCRTHEDAEEAVQDALVGAGGSLASWRGDGPVEGWLVRMVINACHRRRRGQKTDANRHFTDVELPGDDDPEARAQQGEVAVQVGRALATLSPEDRALLLMVDGQGWTPAEVAAETGLNAGAVRTRLSRARARVRGALDDPRP